MEKYHLIGIKGAGMSALAQVLHNMDFYVQGSDKPTMFFTQKPLENLGVKMLNFHKKNIRPGFTFIASNAYDENHEEVQQVLKQGLPFYRYHEFLGKLIQSFTSIAVTGAHGKTSTTGLMAHVFRKLAPTSYIVGDGTGKGVQSPKYFVFEGCEYRRHFLSYQPDYAVITNIDYDHPDYFKDIQDVTDAFQQLVHQVKKHVIAFGDDSHIRSLKTTTSILYYGFKQENDLVATQVRRDEKGTVFEVLYQGQSLGTFFIPVVGDHNILNSLAVIGVCLLEGFDLNLVKNHFQTFAGVRRRFQESRMGSNIMIDDYAHHPTEVAATIQATKVKYPDKKLIAIFQPHTYSRLYHFMDGFASSLQFADEVYLCDIFGSARESEGNVSIQDLLRKVPKSVHLTFDNLHVLQEYKNAVLLFMGAGDIQKYQSRLKSERNSVETPL